ncbi:MAG TPA: RNA polymerase sigma factor [Solirubrobacteraceae bacterium]
METISSAPFPTHVPRLPARLSRLRDETLATLTQKGNEQAFAVLYERYHQPLYRYCRSILRNDADAHDALQSAFASGLAALQRGQRKAPVRPWLFRIAHNEAISQLRRRRSAEDLSEAPPQPASSAEEREAQRARFSQLVADLGELPVRIRAALLMRELSGLSHEEIAIALRTSTGAAKQAIFDARRALHDLAEGRAMDCEEIRRQISDGDGRVLRGRRLRAHLRDCALCSAFADGIPERRADLRALAPPLPAAASAALLLRVTGSVSAHGAGANAAAAGSAATGGVGKAMGTLLASKAAVSATVVAVAAAGAGGVTAVLANVGGHPATHSRQQALDRASNTSSGVGGHRSTVTRRSPNQSRGTDAVRLGSSVSHAATAAAAQGGRAAHGTAARALGTLPSLASGSAGRGKSAQPHGIPQHGVTGRRGAPSQHGAPSQRGATGRPGGGARASGKRATSPTGGQSTGQQARDARTVRAGGSGVGRAVNG